MNINACNVNKGMALVLRVSRVFGVAPLNFTPVSKGYRITVSRRWTYFGPAVFMSYGIICTSAFLFEYFSDDMATLRHYNKTSLILWAIHILTTSYVVGIGTFCAPPSMMRIITYMSKLQKVNVNINHDSSLDLKPIFVWTTIVYCVFGTIILTIVDLALNIYPVLVIRAPMNVSWAFLALWMEQIPIILVRLQFVYIMVSILSTLRTINNNLNQLLHQLKDNYDYSNHRMVNAYSSAYCSLCDVLRNMNESEGGLYFAIIIKMFTSLFVTVYTLMYYIAADSSYRIPNIILHTFWLFMHASVISIFVEPCHRIHVQMENTKYILCRILLLTHTDLLLFDESTKFLQHFTVEKNLFSPLGLFALKRSLIITSFGIITTFIMILVQFKTVFFT